jgi:putative ABC transport system substrate-binding protein
MNRRDMLALLGGAATWPMAARGQQAGMPVVGVLRADAPNASAAAAFRKGLSEMGFVEGRNLSLEFRWAQNDRDRLPELAADLIRRKVDVIAAPASVSGALAAKRLTSTIPIVFSTAFDPVLLGLVASLNRPGGNMTGYSSMAGDLGPKRIGLLHELLPRAGRFGLLVSRDNVDNDRVIRDAQSAAKAIGGQLDVFLAATDHDIDAIFAELAQRRVDALLMSQDVVLGDRQSQILTLAARHALPAIYPERTWAATGGLMSYGPLNDQGRQAGIYAGRVLKGEKPADMPVIRATKFEFVINLATARAIRVDVPPTLLATADEVIE